MARIRIKRETPKSRYWSAHTHSRFSHNDALPSVKELVSKAAELGYPALGLTDHGNMVGSIQLYRECKKAGIKPLPGSEVYLVKDREDKKAKRYHLCLLAYTTQGYRNLVHISSESHRNFHHKPLIDLADLARFHDEGRSEGIALTTGCYFGLVIQTLIEDGYEAAKSVVASFASWFDTYVEVQRHEIDQEPLSEDDIARNLSMIATELDLPMIIAQDSHYTNPEDKESHEALKSLVSWGSDPDDAKFPGDSFHLADEEWMRQHHPDTYERGLAGLQRILDRHDMYLEEIEEYNYRVPSRHDDPMAVLRKKVTKSMISAKMFSPRYRKAVEEELDVIEAARMAGYLVFVAEVCDRMREVAMFYQIRGSAAGSLVCYLLGISDADPLKWKLRFDRFLTKDRSKPPDIDIDIDSERRDELIAWINHNYATVQISTVGTYSLGGDAGPQSGSLRVKALSRMRKVTGEADWESITAEERTQLFALSDLELVSGYGVHAGGLIVCRSAEELARYVPTMYIASSKTTVSQYDMDDIESIGLVKLDVLGVKTLSVIRRTLEMIDKDPKEGLSWIPQSDSLVYRRIAQGDVGGVFQLEGGTSSSWIKRLKPTKIADVIAAMALFRPGVMASGATEAYISRKKKEVPVPQRHDLIDSITKETYGVLLYQDQVIEVLRALGMDSDSLNALLKAVKASNKNVSGAGQTMAKYKQEVLDLSKDAGMDGPTVAWLWEAIEGFSEYCVTGDTEIHLASGNAQGDKTTVAELYRRTETELLPPRRRGSPKYTGPCIICGATSTAQQWTRGACNACYVYRHKFRDVNRGLYALTVNADSRIRPARLLHVIKHDPAQVYKVTLADGKSIRATAEHRHLGEYGFVQVQDLKVGDRLVVDAGYETHRYTEGEENLGVGGQAKLMLWTGQAPDYCQECGHDGSQSRLERAHLDGDRRNNEPENLRMLCVSCHKSHDYQFNKRRRRWQKGHLTELVDVVSIEPDGVEDVYSVVMDDPHIWIANGIATSNSFNRAHSTIYGITAYRCAWLVAHHPMEFHAALLTVASGSDKEKVYTSVARGRGVRLLKPDVNSSGTGYAVERSGRGVVRGLNSIKGVGKVAAEYLAAEQPFKDMDDLAARVNPSKVSGIKPYLKDGDTDVGVIGLLKEAGALKSIGVEQ